MEKRTYPGQVQNGEVKQILGFRYHFLRFLFLALSNETGYLLCAELAECGGVNPKLIYINVIDEIKFELIEITSPHFSTSPIKIKYSNSRYIYIHQT